LANFSDILSPKQECFITLHPNSKRPVEHAWHSNGQTFQKAHFKHHNIGLLLGEPSGLLDVDLDCEAAVVLAKAILPKPHLRFGRDVNHSEHYLYHCSSSGPRKAFTAGGAKTTIVELRGDGAQTMIPPSIHPDGDLISWIDADSDGDEITYDSLLQYVALLAAASELMEHWIEGQRHSLALGFAGLCNKVGIEPEQIENTIRAICQATDDQEIEDRLSAVQTTLCREPQTNVGFKALLDTLGDAVAQNIAANLAGTNKSQSLIQPMPIETSHATVMELGQFADRANVTEAKMGLAFSQWLSGKALYVVQTKQWMIWNDRYWEADLSNEMHNLAFEYVQDVKATLIERNSINDARDLSSFEILNRIQNIIAFAAPRLAVSATKFDVDPMILATGTSWMNLSTGEAHPPCPDILVSKATEVSYSHQARCPTFYKFLDDIFEGNEGLISFVQKAIGYSLTGSTNEQCMFIMIGDGANGKSTFINVINKLLGTYGTTAASQTLVANGGSSVGDDLVDLVGARLITVSETEEGQSLAEAKIKQMTGGDTLKGRPLYGKHVEFSIQGKLWLATNSLPQINNSDHGIWRRIMAIPFNRTFTAEEQDKELISKLSAELPGILNWAIEGCLAWQQQGLTPPAIIEEQIAEYRTSMDSISQFIQDECEVDKDHSYAASKFYQAYREWCSGAGRKPQSTTAFKRSLEKLKGVYQHRSSNGLQWHGIQPCLTY